jgi:hypothetical protein
MADVLSDDLLGAFFAMIACPHSFGVAGQVCTQWRRASRGCRRWELHVMRRKLERRMEKPIVINQQDLGVCAAAVAHPLGLLYTSHEVWTEGEEMHGTEAASFADSCRIALHVWDLRPRTPVHLHRSDQSDRECNPECRMHIDHGFLAVAGSQAGRPQIRHALRPQGRPGATIHAKLAGMFQFSNEDREVSAIHMRAVKGDVFVGYGNGRLGHYLLEYGAGISELSGGTACIRALASHGDELFVGGIGVLDEAGRANVAMFTTARDELQGQMLRPWGCFTDPDAPMSRLLRQVDVPVVQTNVLLVDGERLFAGVNAPKANPWLNLSERQHAAPPLQPATCRCTKHASYSGKPALTGSCPGVGAGVNDYIFIWDDLTEPQDAPPTLAHTLELQHLRHRGGRPIDGVCHLVARGRELFVGINGCESGQLGGVSVECSVQVWRLPQVNELRGDAPVCLHKIPTGHDGSITSMLLADTRLLTWGTDAMLRVWEVFPARGEAAGPLTDPAPWEVDGGAQHPSVERMHLLGLEVDGEEDFEWESDGETEGSFGEGEEGEEGAQDEEGEEGEWGLG